MMTLLSDWLRFQREIHFMEIPPSQLLISGLKCVISNGDRHGRSRFQQMVKHKKGLLSSLSKVELHIISKS